METASSSCADEAPALRVVQLDAQILDDELLSVILNALDTSLGDLSDAPRWQSAYRQLRRAAPLAYYAHQLLNGAIFYFLHFIAEIRHLFLRHKPWATVNGRQIC